MAMANLSQATTKSDHNETIVTYEDPAPPGTTIFIIVLFLLIVATILSNSAVFFAVYAFRGLRTVINCFVISLASADLSVALLSMPTWLIRSLLRHHEDERLVLDMSTLWVEALCCSASIFSATLVAIDRYLAINKPLRYREMVTHQRANRSIIAAWILSFVVALMSYIQYINLNGVYGYTIFVFIIIFCIPLCIMCYSYVCIYRAAVAQLSKMAYNGQFLSMEEEEKRKFLTTERRKRFYKELRITKTLAITVSMFIIAWFPYLIMIFIEIFLVGIRIPIEFQFVVTWAPCVNSFVNPLVYTAINKEFRKALKKLLCSQNSIWCCMQKNDLNRSRETASRSPGGSFHGDDTAITLLNRASNSRRQEIHCTPL